jgi:hypothetical protein
LPLRGEFFSPIKFWGHRDGGISSSSGTPPNKQTRIRFLGNLDPTLKLPMTTTRYSFSVKNCYKGWWVGLHVGGCLSGLWLPHVERRKLSRTRTRDVGVNVRLNLRELYASHLQQKLSCTERTNERNKRTNNWCGWDCCASRFIFLYSIHASSHVRKEIRGRDGVPMKVLESCSRTGKRYHVWTIDVGCAVAASFIDDSTWLDSTRLVYERLSWLSIGPPFQKRACHWFAFWKSARELRILLGPQVSVAGR